MDVIEMKAEKLKNDLSEDLNYAKELYKNGDKEKAIGLYQQIFENNKDCYSAIFALAVHSYNENNINDLRRYAKQMLYNCVSEMSIEQFNDVAFLLSGANEDKLAIKFIYEALEKEPDNFIVLTSLGNCYFKVRSFGNAAHFFKKAAEVKETADSLFSVAISLVEYRDSIGALEYLDRAVLLDNKDDKIFCCYGTSYINLGRLKEAEDNLLKAIEINDRNAVAYYRLSDAKKFKEEDNWLIEKMENLLNDSKDLSKNDVAILHFALGKIYADIKKYKESFKHYNIANAIKNEDREFNLVAHVDVAKRYISVFTKEFLSSRKNYGSKSKLPIFIVGMPRSGTTLTEQIISSHSKVHGIGEEDYLEEVVVKIKNRIIPDKIAPVPFPESLPYMTKKEILDLANQYLAKLTEGIGVCKKVSNKLPANYTHVALISLLFPGAKIIHCRRHPLDIFLSIYFQNFSYVDFAFDASSIVGVYKVYNQLMKNWKQVVNIDIYEIFYEEMLLKQEEKSRELIKFCGLNWEDACLDFHKNKRAIYTASHAQVRQKIYTSSMFKWKKYEEFIINVKDALSEEIAEHEAELNLRLEV